MWLPHNEILFSLKKKNEVLIHAICMNPENIMLSGIRQTQKDKYLIPPIWDTYNKQRHRDGEQSCQGLREQKQCLLNDGKILETADCAQQREYA